MKNNLARIIYRNTADGKIEILRFENVLTEEGLKDRFGDEVARIYLYEENSFQMNQLRNYIFCRYGQNLETGLISKELFQDRIEYLKRAGKRLGEIRKQVALEKFNKEHVIEI